MILEVLGRPPGPDFWLCDIGTRHCLVGSDDSPKITKVSKVSKFIYDKKVYILYHFTTSVLVQFLVHIVDQTFNVYRLECLSVV